MAYRDFPCFEAILWSGENSIGPRTFCGAKSRVYDGFNRLRQVRKGGTTAQYTYNAEGIRTAKTVNGETTQFILDGGNVIGEVNAQNQVTNYIRGASGVILSKDPSNVTKYYVTNGHGDVMGLTDTTGAVVKSYEYDAFGQEYSPASDDPNPFRYCGEYFDKETQSIYLRARYYSPASGRFTQQDPAMDGLNWYVYCASNPVNRIDTTGLTWDEFQWATDLYGVNVAMKAFKISEDARKAGETYAKAMGYTQSWDNKADAWRHFLWNARMTREIGYSEAKVLANNHELKGVMDLNWVDNSTKFQTAGSVRTYTKMNQAVLMDLWNNQVGRELANNVDFKDKSYNELWEYAVQNNLIIQNAEDVYKFLGIESYINTDDWTVDVGWDMDSGNVTVTKDGKSVTLKIGV